MTDLLDELFAGYGRTMTPSQVAEALGISEATAYRRINEGEVPSIRLGNTTVIYRDALLAALRRGASPAMRDVLAASGDPPSKPD